MAKGHQKQTTPGAFGHDGQPEVKHQFRGRTNVGGSLHQCGKGRKPRELRATVAQAVVVHIEKTEAELKARIVAGLARANAMIGATRVAVADRELARARQAREDICNIVHLAPAGKERQAQIAALIAAYNPGVAG